MVESKGLGSVGLKSGGWGWKGWGRGVAVEGLELGKLESVTETAKGTVYYDVSSDRKNSSTTAKLKLR